MLVYQRVDFPRKTRFESMSFHQNVFAVSPPRGHGKLQASAAWQFTDLPWSSWDVGQKDLAPHIGLAYFLMIQSLKYSISTHM